ncbi:MAG TPA: beta-ketoacyl-[acyl-carrier-protein] synthase family protein [Pseudonocardiaceae bacterium]
MSSAIDHATSQAMSSQVLITGLGAISCLGRGTEAFWRGMTAADSAPARAEDPNAHMKLPLMYSVPGSDVPVEPRTQDGLPLGDASRYALVAAREALADAGLADGWRDPARVAVVLGTGMGDSGLHERWHVDGGRTDGGWVPTFAPASVLGAALGVGGATTSVSNACAASGFGISLAADLIRSGEADVVVTGGAEAYSRVALACFNRLGAVDSSRCRPFDLHREGTVFGEGSAILVLESAAHAAERGVSAPYATIAGAGWSCDAHHTTAPEPEGSQIIRGMREALAEAGVATDQVGCVVPHGTGTQLNDVVEAKALNTVLGSAIHQAPLYSLKALVGHTGGAAGALATLAATLILSNRRIPANVPCAEQDPECKVTLSDTEIPLTGSCVLVNAYAFGGNNVSLVLTEPRS